MRENLYTLVKADEDRQKKWRGVLLGYFPQKTSPKIREKL